MTYVPTGSPEVAAPSPEVATPLTWRQGIARYGAAALLGFGLGGAVGGGVAALRPVVVEGLGGTPVAQLQFGNDEVNVDLGISSIVYPSGTKLPTGDPIGLSLRFSGNSFADVNGGNFSTRVQQLASEYGDITSVREVVQAALHDNIISGAKCGAFIGVLAVPTLYRIKREQGIDKAWLARSKTLHVSPLLLSLLVTGNVSGSTMVQHEHAPITPSPYFKGTPLEGAELRGFANAGVELGLEKWKETQDIYKSTAVNMEASYDNLADKGAAPPNTDAVLVVSDKHCNVGMDRVIVVVAKKFGVQLVIDAGDMDAFGQLGAEAACTSGMAASLRAEDIPEVAVDGNHDSDITLRNLIKQKVTTLVGKVVKVKGIRLIGSSDPRRTKFGVDTPPSSPDNKDLADQADRLVDTVNNTSDPVDIGVAHDPAVGARLAKVVPLAISGHLHQTPAIVPIEGDDGSTHYLLIAGTTGGSAPNKWVIGTELGQTAYMSLVYINRDTHKPVGYRTIAANPDKSTSISAYTTMPVAKYPRGPVKLSKAGPKSNSPIVLPSYKSEFPTKPGVDYSMLNKLQPSTR